MNFKEKHLVVKHDDIREFLSRDEILGLSNLLSKIETGRELKGKKNNQYFVVNIDEDYASDIGYVLCENGCNDGEIVVDVEGSKIKKKLDNANIIIRCIKRLREIGENCDDMMDEYFETEDKRLLEKILTQDIEEEEGLDKLLEKLLGEWE